MATFTHRTGWRRRDAIRLEALDAGDVIPQTIRITGRFYESELLRYLHRMLGRRPSVVVDVGANIGNHSVFFARYIASHVIAVEPNPDLVPVIERNLARNAEGLATWSVVRAAVGATEGVGVLQKPAGPGNIGMARVRQTGPGVPVKITTIDRILEACRAGGEMVPVRLIKIDVEGMEAAVLEGAHGALEEFRPDLIVEAQTEQGYRRVEEIVGPYGYRPLSTQGDPPVYHFVWRPGVYRRIAARWHLLRAWLGRHGRAFLARRWPRGRSGHSLAQQRPSDVPLR